MGADLERLLRYGPKVLSGAELLALVLGSGGRVPALQIAAILLGRWGSLAGLAEVPPVVLSRPCGMGPVRAARLVAAVELGKRCQDTVPRFGVAVQRPQDLQPLLAEEFRGCDREHFLALYLNSGHRVVAVETVSIGSLNASLVHPREVFKPAVRLGAAAVIVAHNHPSGCPEPSGEDLELTGRLIHCGRLLGIELLDHIIMGHRELLSLREHRWPDPAEEAVLGFVPPRG